MRDMDVSEGESAIKIFTLTNRGGVTVRLTNYGAIVLAVRVPDGDGTLGDAVIGYDSVEEYARDTRYVGAVVGRYANRIANARCTIDGVTYGLTANDGPHHLHGGRTGFGKVVWRAAPFESNDRRGVVLAYTSPDGDEGYPGTLETRVTYTLTDRTELIVEYRATTDKTTPVNLTQHSYFNLAGSGGVLGHRLQINADAMTPVDRTLIPTGTIVPVAGGPLDFRSPTVIGARRDGLYDQNFVLNRADGELVHAARLVEPRSQRTLDVHTTEPGLQLYTGYVRGVCLETQHYPNSPNEANFPSTLLRPGREYRSRTIFTFGVER
jgi:aldose 1-epimerase